MKKGDIAVCFLILIAGIALLLFQMGTDTANTVEIYSAGKLYGKYDLHSNTVVNVVTDYGKNIVCIENGHVYVTDSNCKDKDEILQGKIRRSGQSLICLPNKLVVTVKGRREKVDSISY